MNIGARTLERWRAEGMHVERDGNRLLVEESVVRAWKRWKSMKNVRHGKRRRVDFAGGVSSARVTDAQLERARLDWIAAGDRDEEAAP